MDIFNNIINGNLDEDIELIEHAENEIFTEAALQSSIPYLKLVTRKITMDPGNPKGRGNICLLYTHNVKDSIDIINDNKNFISRFYNFYYYDRFYKGKIFNKLFKFNNTQVRANYYKDVKSKTNCKCKLNVTDGINSNIYYDLSEHLKIFESIGAKIQPVRYMNTYWAYIDGIIKSISKIPNYDKKFILVNLDQFNITKDLKENLKNPLYMIYYTLLRNPKLLVDIDIDFYMYSNNKVIRINPSSSVGGKKLNKVDDTINDVNDTLNNISDRDAALSGALIGIGGAKVAGANNTDALKAGIIGAGTSIVSNNIRKEVSNKINDVANVQIKKVAKQSMTLIKRTMNKIYSSNTVDTATNVDRLQKEEILQQSISKLTDTFIPASELIDSDDELSRYSNIIPVEKDIINKAKEVAKTDVQPKRIIDRELNQIDNTSDVDEDEPSPEEDTTVDNEENEQDNEKQSEIVKAKVQQELDNDKEIIEDIYNKTKRELPKKSEKSTARDKLLREKQKDIMVGNMTIKDIENIKANNVPIPVTDISNVVKNSNKNVTELKFINLDKTYNEKIMKKDIIGAFTDLNNKSIPMFIRDVKVEDTSDELNYKDTYTVLLEDGNRKRHTVKVDIPKFYENKFLYFGGNKKILKHQDFYIPVVKISESMVQIVTNYSKMSIERIETKSLSIIERFKKFITAYPEIQKLFVVGNSFSSNRAYVTSLEYDELSKLFIEFKNKNTHFMFNQIEVQEYMSKHNIPDKKDYMYIGKYEGKDCYIHIDRQLADNQLSIVEMIVNTFSDELKEKFYSIKSTKRMMYARIRVMSQNVSAGMILSFWTGFTNLIKKINLEYELMDRVPKELPPNREFIKFKDTVLVYKETVPISLIMNGIKMFDTNKYNFEDFDDVLPYLDYIKKVYGRSIIENALNNFYEFMIDNITREILIDLELPTDLVDLTIYAITLLSDSQYIPEINQNLYRVRCGEVIPGILYHVLADQYVNFRNFNGTKKFSIKRDAVISELSKLQTLEDYSTLNPSKELDQLHNITTKGFRGVNLEESYTVPRRIYDKSMIGVMSPQSPPDASTGVMRTLSMEPSITNVRGYTLDKSDKLDELKDVNLFTPSELLIPLGVINDDPTRLGHAIKQSSHVIPVKKSSPVLISNGVEETVRFQLSSSFVINADEDGEIVDYDKDSNIMIAKYKSGKCRAIELNPFIVKNGGGGFYLSNQLITDLKVGSKFKKNAVLAYHKNFFINDNYNNCRTTIGTLCKIALTSSYNTYNDATFITEKLSEEASTEMCFCKSAVVGKNSNVFYMIKKGEEVKVGEPLIRFDTSFDDSSINQLLKNLSEDEKESIMEGSRNEIKSKYSGVIEDIKIYSAVELDDMSDSLRSIVSSYYRKINKKRSYLNKYDPEGNTVKCGIMLTEGAHKIEPNKYGVIKGQKAEDSVLIEFYIKHSEPLEIGSKIANFTGLKNTIEEIIPKGYEPYSEFRPNEEISSFIAPQSLLKRMTPSILITAFGYKCIIELKRALKELFPNRAKMEDLIYKVFNALDTSGTNTKKYKALFSPMSNEKFNKYFKGLFADENAYLILDVVDYEHTITIEDCERAAKVLNIPLYEKVYQPFASMDKDNVPCTKEPVPVGYILIKRTQQTILKKNGISIDIDKRSALTGQVTGSDKNGRQSDLENIMLTSMGLKNCLKELNGPRADDLVMKQDMLKEIALNGYVKLEDLPDEIKNKTTLNTVDTFFRGMTLESDLVVKGLMLPKTLKTEI